MQYTMERGVVHACHAGGAVHYLEGWTHHEVGALDVNRIDVVWKAALKHGFRPVTNYKKHNDKTTINSNTTSAEPKQIEHHSVTHHQTL